METVRCVTVLILTLFFSNRIICDDQLPIVITTWKFTSATEEAWNVIQNSSSLDAIEKGCSICEVEQCDGTVGYGGSPDESGETTLDALIMDGSTMNVGAVAAVRRIKNVIAVARKVLENTAHSILAGDLATKFAVEMGFKEETLSTSNSIDIWQKWINKKCQPNFWQNVTPDPKTKCGPYSPLKRSTKSFSRPQYSRKKYRIGNNNHDTIGMVAIDIEGNIVAGTSTNGAKHKIPGRVGDSPIPGAGGYADNTVGGAVATGDGDVMLRFLPSFVAVDEMRRGMVPTEAARAAILRIGKIYPSFSGAVVAVDKLGNYGAACHGMEEFPFSIGNPESNSVRIETVKCAEPFTTNL